MKLFDKVKELKHGTINFHKLCIFLITFILMTLALLYTYVDVVRPTMGARERYISNTIRGYTVPLEDGVPIHQTLRAVSDTVQGFSLAFDTYRGASDMQVDIDFVDPKQNKVIHSWTLNMKDAVDGGYSSMFLDNPYAVSRGKIYELVITPHSNGGQNANIYFARENLSGKMITIQNKEINDSLAYEVLGGVGVGSSRNVFIAFSLGMYALLFAGFFLASTQFEIEKKFVLLALIMGVIYLFAIPPFAAPDEEVHFLTAYEKSSTLLGKTALDENGNVIGRSEDFSYFSRTKIPRRETYAQYLKGALNLIDNSYAGDVTFNAPMDLTGIEYVPQILGISFARIFAMNGEQLLLLGRLFALLFYTTLIYWAIKLIPFGKNILFVVALLPMCLQQAASFSYDASLISLAFFMTSYYLYLIYSKEKVEKKDIVFLVVLTAWMSPIKVVYIVIAGLGILIPYQKFGGKVKKWVCAAIILAGGIVSMLIASLSGVSSLVGHSGDLSWTEEKGYTLEKVLSGPVHLIGVFFRTFVYASTDWVNTLIGQRLGWLTIEIPNVIVIGFAILLFVSIIGYEGEMNKMKLVDKIWIGFLCFGSIVGICMSMLLAWTRESSLCIEGVQGRYFLPILPLLLLLFKNSRIVLKKSIESILVMAIVVLQMGTLIIVFQKVVGS
ncbi:MAG: DUF2142 domain-containing protein [Lachnospiraceae bacterium]|nr:DUF2142 domain-containing protein [Lachnospiraceae bacterium]